MESDTGSIRPQSPTSTPAPTPSDTYPIALLEMEARLTCNMKDMLEPLKTDINSLVLNQKEWEQQKNDVQELKAAKNKLDVKLKEIEQNNIKLEDQVKTLETKLMESNLIIHRVNESKWELDSTHNELVFQAIAETVHAEDAEKKLEIACKIPITSTARVGKYSPLCGQLIRVSFACKKDADLLMERKKSLKEGIYVDHEYSKEEETERKLLCPILRAARKKSHYRGKCKLDGTSIIIKGKSYNRKKLEHLPDDISGPSVSSKESDNIIGFFRELNPLSNFHPCTFRYDGFKYHSSEQLIQHMKAKLFGDSETTRKILTAKTALECKRLSKDIVNYNHEQWKSKARVRCEEGIKAKFMQNIGCRSYLLSTGEKRIIECCNDKLWGTGVPLHDENHLRSSNWTSQGILGEILEET